MQIIYTGVHGNPEDLSLETDIEYIPNHHAQLPRQQIDGHSNSEPSKSVFHTYYSRHGNVVKIFTKHFSLFRLLCKKHGNHRAYEGYLSAHLYQRQRKVANVVKIDVIAVLDVLNSGTEVGACSYQPKVAEKRLFDELLSFCEKSLTKLQCYFNGNRSVSWAPVRKFNYPSHIAI